MFTQKIFILFITAILGSGCNGINDPEGIWQKDQDPNFRFLILNIDNGIAVRSPDMKTWDQGFNKAGPNEYVSKSNRQKLQFKTGEKLEITVGEDSKPTTYSKIIPETIDAKFFTPKMTREQVQKFIGEPGEEWMESPVEKWLYNNNFLLIFDKEGLAKMNVNYKKERDFSKVQKGMTQVQVVETLGNPDDQGIKKESGSGFQEWYYGTNTAIVFDSKGVISIKTDLDKKSPAMDNSIPIEQQYGLLDLVNDKPAGFVIESQFNEFLQCNCTISEEGPLIHLKGEKASVNIVLQPERKFMAHRAYTINSGEISSAPANEVELFLSSTRFEKGNSIIGFLSLEDNCLLEKGGDEYPCYFKGTFECTFQ